MNLITKLGLGIAAISTSAIAEDNTKIDHTFTSIKKYFGQECTISKPDTIQTNSGEIYSIKTDSPYLLANYIIDNHGGIEGLYKEDFDLDGIRDRYVLSEDRTKFVDFSTDDNLIQEDMKTWYIFPKNIKIKKEN